MRKKKFVLRKELDGTWSIEFLDQKILTVRDSCIETGFKTKRSADIYGYIAIQTLKYIENKQDK